MGIDAAPAGVTSIINLYDRSYTLLPEVIYTGINNLNCSGPGGKDAWTHKRWDNRGDMPGVTKEELAKMKLKY